MFFPFVLRVLRLSNKPFPRVATRTRRVWPRQIYPYQHTFQYYFISTQGASGPSRREAQNSRYREYWCWYVYIYPSSSWPRILNLRIDIEESGVRLHLTVVDTPGFGDFVNNDDR